MSLLSTKKEILPGISLEDLLKLSEKEIEKTLAELNFIKYMILF